MINTKKPKLAIDLDGVMGDFLKQYAWYYKAFTGRDLNLSALTHYYAFDKEMLRKFLDIPNFYLDMEPIEGAVEGIKTLRESFDIIVITARALWTGTITELWVNTLFGEGIELFVVENPRDKLEILLQEKCFGIVEDRFETLKDVLNEPELSYECEPYLFSQPYNQLTLEELVTYPVTICLGWGDVVTLVTNDLEASRSLERSENSLSPCICRK